MNDSPRKKLIEVSLPLDAINKASAREKNNPFIESGAVGTPMQELMALLPALSRDQVRTLLRDLRRDGKAHPAGITRAVRWHAGPEDEWRGRDPKRAQSRPKRR